MLKIQFICLCFLFGAPAALGESLNQGEYISSEFHTTAVLNLKVATEQTIQIDTYHFGSQYLQLDSTVEFEEFSFDVGHVTRRGSLPELVCNYTIQFEVHKIDRDHFTLSFVQPNLMKHRDGCNPSETDHYQGDYTRRAAVEINYFSGHYYIENDPNLRSTLYAELKPNGELNLGGILSSGPVRLGFYINGTPTITGNRLVATIKVSKIYKPDNYPRSCPASIGRNGNGLFAGTLEIEKIGPDQAIVRIKAPSLSNSCSRSVVGHRFESKIRFFN